MLGAMNIAIRTLWAVEDEMKWASFDRETIRKWHEIVMSAVELWTTLGSEIREGRKK